MVSKSERFELRMDQEIFQEVDAWREKQTEQLTRAEAIRRLVQLGLQASDRQGYMNMKMQIAISARQPDSPISDAMAYAWENDIYPAFDHKRELWAAPFEQCFSVSKEQILDLGQFLDDHWLKRKGLTFYELEAKYRSKQWDRSKLIVSCRYMFLSDMFSDYWDQFLAPGEYPTEASGINADRNSENKWNHEIA